jgi:hypothetical protein
MGAGRRNSQEKLTVAQNDYNNSISSYNNLDIALRKNR